MRLEASIGVATISFNLACHSGKSSALTLAALSNRVYARRKVNATSPVGPLRCLAISRSEEHTSELQSQSNLVCRLLLEKKKKNIELQTTRLNSSHSQISYTVFLLKKK